MIVRALRYSYAQAVTKALKSKLLSPDDWHYLLHMRSRENALQYLGGTGYSQVLAGLAGTEPDAAALSLVLHDELFRNYGKLIKAVPARSAQLILTLVVRYEAENLKTIFRGIWQGKSPSEIGSLLYRLGGLSMLPFADLLQLRELEAAAELLQRTVFYSPFSHALPVLKAQARLFPLEIALDISALEQIPAALKRIGGIDRREAQVLLGELIDRVNLCWLVRFRHYYGLSPEETINYALRGGAHLTLRDLGKLARALDLPSFMDVLPGPYKRALEPAADWSEIGPLFESWFVAKLYEVFRKDPFRIGLQLGYLLLKEIEVKALASLFSAIEVGVLPAGYANVMNLPLTKGDIRVQV